MLCSRDEVSQAFDGIPTNSTMHTKAGFNSSCAISLKVFTFKQIFSKTFHKTAKCSNLLCSSQPRHSLALSQCSTRRDWTELQGYGWEKVASCCSPLGMQQMFSGAFSVLRSIEVAWTVLLGSLSQCSSVVEESSASGKLKPLLGVMCFLNGMQLGRSRQSHEEKHQRAPLE